MNPSRSPLTTKAAAAAFVSSEDPAAARKRRIQQRRRCANTEEEDDYAPTAKRTRNEKTSTSDDESDESSPSSQQQVPSLRGIKKQTRYEPGVPMPKDQLAAWRKEARRVRNRESAAASRQKTRQRIEELEVIVSELEQKYASALDMIQQLQKDKAKLLDQVKTSAPSPTPPPPPQVSPVSSPKVTPTITTVDPHCMSLSSSSSAPFIPSTAPLSCRRPTLQQQQMQMQHLPLMITRPTAA
jgi:bZIP transcription factor